MCSIVTRQVTDTYLNNPPWEMITEDEEGNG